MKALQTRISLHNLLWCAPAASGINHLAGPVEIAGSDAIYVWQRNVVATLIERAAKKVYKKDGA